MNNNQKTHIQESGICKEKGVGLIEVLIAMLVFGTALVTLSGLQSRSLQFNQSAYLRSQASMLAYDIIDRIRINRIKLSDTTYDIQFDSTDPTGTAMNFTDIINWRKSIKASLPEGQGEIECDNAKRCTVKIKWIEQAESAGGANDTVIFTYSTEI